MLDTLTSRERQVALFERYGALLTDQQRTVLDLYLRRDWSLSEVAATRQTSRAAVHDLVRRTTATLEDYELRLGLLDEARRRSEVAARLNGEIADLRRRLTRVETAVGKL